MPTEMFIAMIRSKSSPPEIMRISFGNALNKFSSYLRADPNADPDHAGSGRRHWSGEVGKTIFAGVLSTKRVGKRRLKFEPNLRVQEAPGSNPGTPTTGPWVSSGIRGFSLAFHHFFGELNFWRFGLTQTRPIREKFQGVPGWLARYSLLISVLICLTFKLPGP